jgi:predicted O-methyltransferase YrrM
VKFTEDWFGEASQQALARLARGTDGVPGVVVEVGCWEGRSTIALANTVAPDWVYAIDTWQGSDGEISAELAAERDVFATFTENVREGTSGNVAPMKMDWRHWFDRNRQRIRFLHIDAEHSYREVHDNIVAALPWLSPGAIICGDDAHHPPVIQAVQDVLGPNFNMTATLWWQRIGVT